MDLFFRGCVSPPLRNQGTVPVLGQIQVALRSLCRPLLKCMQHVDTLCELRDVQDPVLDLGMDAAVTPGPTLGIGFQSLGSSPC